MSKAIALLKRVSLILFIFIIFSSLVRAQNLATGLLPETPQGNTWLRNQFPRIKKVRPNSIFVARLNAERRQKRKSAVTLGSDVAEIGQEVIFEGEPVALQAQSDLGAPPLPVSVDNSLLSAFPPIGDQGALGTCLPFTTNYYQLTYEMNLLRGTTASGGDPNNIYSPKWSYNLQNAGFDTGMTFSAGYAILSSNGSATLAQVPYDSNFLEWNVDGSVWRSAIRSRIGENRGLIPYSDTEGMTAIKQMVANGHVLTFGTYILSWEFFPLSNDPNTTADDAFVGQQSAAYANNYIEGAHALTVVGYNDDVWTDINKNGIVDDGEKGAFKVANQWGTSWSNSGFAWMSYESMRIAPTVVGGPAGRSGSIINFDYYKSFYWAMPSPNYTPTILGEITLNHAKRNQFSIALGVSDLGKLGPDSSGYPGIFGGGGAFAFDGKTNPIDGTFVFDFSDLNKNLLQAKRYWMLVVDGAPGSPLTIKSYKLTDASGNALATAPGLPASIDADVKDLQIDYVQGMITPTPTPNPTFGPTPSPTPTVSPTVVPGPRIIGINAGGNQYYSLNGDSFAADQNFSGGEPWTWPDSSISNTVEGSALYRSVRYSEKNFKYFFPVASGSYALKLRFLEGDSGFSGRSPFSVAINGVTVLSNFDVGSNSGGVNLALDKVFNVTVGSEPGVEIVFTNNATSGRAMVSAIELSSNDSNPPPTPNFNGTKILGINSGGSQYTGPVTSEKFSQDQNFSGGETWTWNSKNPKNTQESSALYHSVRYSPSSFNYLLPVADGNYSLKLRFLEGDQGFAGKSPFSISINGNTVLSNFDIATSAGGVNTALDKVFAVTASGGQGIKIIFSNPSATGRAMVSGLDLYTANVSGVLSSSRGRNTLGAKFTFSTTVGKASKRVKFNGSKSIGKIANYSWNFGDNKTGRGKSVTHSYAKAGTYFTNLTVTDKSGASSLAVTKIIVK